MSNLSKKNNDDKVVLTTSEQTSENNDIPTNSPKKNTPKKTKDDHPLVEMVRFAIIALIIVVPIRWFIAQPFIVSGASMEKTFHTGEYIIVDQLTYYLEEPKRGDVIIFRYPRDPSKFFIKRLIALPGDTLKIDGNVVTIINKDNPQGVILDEPYIKSMRPNTFITEKLGDNEYFVMGDNRDASSDSRSWGIVTREKIIGRAFVRLFPVDKIGLLPGKYNEGVKSAKNSNTN